MTRREHRGEDPGLVDYAIVLAGIALVAFVALVFFGDAVAAGLDLVGDLIDNATR